MKRSTKQNLSHGPRRVLCALLAAVFVLSLAGCGSGSASFTWFVDTIPSNLDPQVASTASDVIACENLYSGLVRKDASGKLVPALAEHWEVSSDRRTYTFTLKSGLTYTATKGAATDYAITAEDFVFAFRRMFRADTASPYAVEFSAIENSAAVLAGQLPETALGVQARGDATLVFCLSEPDENFLSKLTLPGAMPCDEDFFNSTRGTYGLSAASTLSSGSFYLYNWTASGLFLRREPSGNRIDSLRLVQNTGASGQSAAQLIANEKCSAALDETGEATSLQSISYSDTTWSLLFNCNSVFGSTPLRQAMAEVARTAASTPDSGLFAPATGLIPDGLTVDGIDYRDAAGDPTPAPVDAVSLYREARQGMSNSDFNNVTLLLPAGSGLTQAAEEINGEWQKQFSSSSRWKKWSRRNLKSGLPRAIIPLRWPPSAPRAAAYTTCWPSSPPRAAGSTGYANSLYATQLAASSTATGSARCSLLADCERQLLSDCAVVPLFSQQKRLLIADGIQGLVFDPFGPVLDLTETTLKK